MPQRKAITNALQLIFRGIDDLKQAFNGRRNFTIDGRLVGDIGEVLAELEYDLVIDDVQQANYDATTPTGSRVQIKATFKDSLTLSSVPEFYLGLKVYEDGRFEEVYNGPGIIIAEHFKHRKGIGAKLLSFPVKSLKALQAQVPEDKKIKHRTKQNDLN
jgi:hypothetical protein